MPVLLLIGLVAIIAYQYYVVREGFKNANDCVSGCEYGSNKTYKCYASNTGDNCEQNPNEPINTDEFGCSRCKRCKWCIRDNTGYCVSKADYPGDECPPPPCDLTCPTGSSCKILSTGPKCIKCDLACANGTKCVFKPDGTPKCSTNAPANSENNSGNSTDSKKCLEKAVAMTKDKCLDFKELIKSTNIQAMNCAMTDLECLKKKGLYLNDLNGALMAGSNDPKCTGILSNDYPDGKITYYLWTKPAVFTPLLSQIPEMADALSKLNGQVPPNIANMKFMKFIPCSNDSSDSKSEGRGTKKELESEYSEWLDRDFTKERDSNDRWNQSFPLPLTPTYNNMSKTSKEADESKKKSDMLRDIQSIVHNELVSNLQMTSSNSQPYLQKVKRNGKSKDTCDDCDDDANDQIAEQQGKEMSTTRPKRPCPQDMNDYIRKDSIPCMGCTLDY